MLKLLLFSNVLAIGLFKKDSVAVFWYRILFLIFSYVLLLTTTKGGGHLYNDFWSFSLFLFSRSEYSYSSSSIEKDGKLNLNIQWFALNENGFLKNSDEFLQNKAAIYIYQFILDEQKVYIGSTYNLKKRFDQHRTLVNNGSTTCPESIFYHFIRLINMDGIILNLVF